MKAILLKRGGKRWPKQEESGDKSFFHSVLALNERKLKSCVQLLLRPTHRKGGKCGTKAYCLVEYGGCGGSSSMVVLLARVLLGLCSLMAGPYPYFSRFTVKSEHCRNELLSS